MTRISALLALGLAVNLAGCAMQPTADGDLALNEAAAENRELPTEIAETEEQAPFPDLQVDGSSNLAPFEVEQNIWLRMREGYGMETALESSLEQPRVQSHLDWHRCRVDFLERVTARSEPYLHLILDEIEQRNLPTELALLPIVESAYIPYAYSHGRAAGLWQFIPATGRRFGLKQNWWYDGRRDVLESTRAALDYLEYLNKRFDGDWLLALAAYNAGEGNVGRAIRRNEARGRPTDFWHLDLPRETENYVPKLLAVAALVGDPDFYGASLWPIPDEPYLAAVPLPSQIDLAVAAELAEMDVDEIYMLNPGFNRWATDPNGPHSLLLPIERAEVFRARLAEIPPTQLVTWQRHQIRSGETLGHIAERYGTTVSIIKRSNQLRTSRIRAGDYLLVPVAQRPTDDYSLTSEQRRASIQNVERDGRRIQYEVQPGDSFWDIARRYNVSVNQLAKWNGMAPRDTLRAGDQLVIWVPDSANLQESSLRLPDLERRIPGDTVRRVSYAVRQGDSLFGIARRFSVDVADIRRWNRIDGSLLRPGQRLTLFVDVTELDS